MEKNTEETKISKGLQARREYNRAYQKRYRKEHPDRVRQQQKNWRLRNPEKVKEINARYWERRAAAEEQKKQEV